MLLWRLGCIHSFELMFQSPFMLGYILIFLRKSLVKCGFGFWLTYTQSFFSELPLFCGKAQSSNRTIKWPQGTRIQEAPWRKIGLTSVVEWCWSCLNLLLNSTYAYLNSANGYDVSRIRKMKSMGQLLSHSLFQSIFMIIVIITLYILCSLCQSLSKCFICKQRI